MKSMPGFCSVRAPSKHLKYIPPLFDCFIVVVVVVVVVVVAVVVGDVS